MTADALRKIVPFKVELSADEKEFIRTHVARLTDSGWLTKGAYVEQFEARFAAETGASYCAALSSGTAALDALCRAFGLRGYEVLVPANTNFGTAAGVTGAGAIPVFYDGGLYAGVAEIEKRVSRRTGAVVVVHIGGYISPEIFAIRAFCRKRHLLLLEDASHAHFAEAGKVKAGAIGDGAAFSLFVTKVLTCGEGGVVTTNRRDVRDKVNALRDQGKNKAGLHVLPGNSWRMSEMNAIVGLAQLQNSGETIASLRRIDSAYRASLSPLSPFELPLQPDGWFPSGHKFVACLRSRAARRRLAAAMKEKAIEMGRGVYEKPLNVQPVFREYSRRAFPLAADFAARHVCFPIFRSMRAEELQRVIDAARIFARGG